MRIRWLNDLTLLHVWANLEGWRGDEYERDFLKSRHPDLALGAFVDGKCVGVITGALHVKSAWISHFLVNPQYRFRGIGRALFEHLLQILENLRPQIWLHAAPNMEKFYAKYGFEKIDEIHRYAYKPKQKSFYFEPNPNLEKPRLTQKILELDQNAFRENRKDYLEYSFSHPSSLLLANSKGYLHSRMMDGKYLFIGPFVAQDLETANYLLKGLLFYRGSKSIILDSPTKDSAHELLENAHFKKSSTTFAMTKGEKNPPLYGQIYAFGSSGVWG